MATYRSIDLEFNQNGTIDLRAYAGDVRVSVSACANQIPALIPASLLTAVRDRCRAFLEATEQPQPLKVVGRG